MNIVIKKERTEHSFSKHTLQEWYKLLCWSSQGCHANCRDKWNVFPVIPTEHNNNNNTNNNMNMNNMNKNKETHLRNAFGRDDKF